VLDRIAFGPSAADVAHVKQIGIDRDIDEQLHPEMIPEPAALSEKLDGLDTLNLDAAQLFTEYGPILPIMNGGVGERCEAVTERLQMTGMPPAQKPVEGRQERAYTQGGISPVGLRLLGDHATSGLCKSSAVPSERRPQAGKGLRIRGLSISISVERRSPVPEIPALKGGEGAKPSFQGARRNSEPEPKNTNFAKLHPRREVHCLGSWS